MVDGKHSKITKKRAPKIPKSVPSKKTKKQSPKQDSPSKPASSQTKQTGNSIKRDKRPKRQIKRFSKPGKVKSKELTSQKKQNKNSIETIDVDSNWSAFLKERLINKKGTKRKGEEDESEDESPSKKKSKTKTGGEKKQKKSHLHKPADSQSKELAEKTTESKDKQVWFDDVDEIHIENKSDKQTGIHKGLTETLATDCEMVGVGKSGVRSILARVSIVNQYGHCVYDKFVKPTEKVTDYRTWVSGVTPELLKNAEEFEVVKKEVGEIFKGRTVVGHSVINDLKSLQIDHPSTHIRDTQQFPSYIALNNGRKPGLKLLCKKILGLDIQSAEHSSVEDAQATMRLYTLVKHQWETKMPIKVKTFGPPRINKRIVFD